MARDVSIIKRELERFQEANGGRIYLVKLAKEVANRIGEDKLVMVPANLRHTPFVAVARQYGYLGSEETFNEEDVVGWEPVNVTDLVLELEETREKSEIGTIGTISRSFDTFAIYPSCRRDSDRSGTGCIDGCVNNCGRFDSNRKELEEKAAVKKNLRGKVLAPIFCIDINESRKVTLSDLERSKPEDVLAYFKRNPGIAIGIEEENLWRKRDDMDVLREKFIKYDIQLNYNNVSYSRGSFARSLRRKKQDKLTYNRLKYPKFNFIHELECDMHRLLTEVIDSSITQYQGGSTTACHIHNLLSYVESFRRIRRFKYRQLKSFKAFKRDSIIYLKSTVIGEREKKAIMKIVA